MKKILILLISILMLFSACKKTEVKKEEKVKKTSKTKSTKVVDSKTSKSKQVSKQKTKTKTSTKVAKRDIKSEILKEYKKWRGTKYKFGGIDKKGIDCSAYTMAVYKSVFKINLKRTTGLQMKMGKQVKNLKSLRIGDLLFFETKKNVWHVGIYLGKGEFTHASSSKGVIISKLSNPYWSKRYKKARRFL